MVGEFQQFRESSFLLMKIFQLAVTTLSLALAGCTGGELPKGEPSFYASLAQPGAKVDAAANPELAARFRVTTIPTLLLFRNGQVVGQMLGLKSKKELLAWVTRP